MKTWLVERWTDPAKFIATLRAAGATLGALLAFDIIPTGVPGLGPKLAAGLNIILFGTTSSTKTNTQAAVAAVKKEQ